MTLVSLSQNGIQLWIHRQASGRSRSILHLLVVQTAKMHVLDCLSGYLWLGARLAEEETLADAFNFGPRPEAQRPVRELVDTLLQHWPGEWTDASGPNAPHEAPMLSLNIDKAATVLNWMPVWDFAEDVQQTARWYQQRHQDESAAAADLCRAQLEAYAAAASAQSCVWAR